MQQKKKNNIETILKEERFVVNNGINILKKIYITYVQEVEVKQKRQQQQQQKQICILRAKTTRLLNEEAATFNEEAATINNSNITQQQQ